jgi:hypothetical protein
MDEPEPLTLSNVCGGAVEEVFQRELEAVLDNIADVNTKPDAKRVIRFEFVFKPFAKRDGGEVEFSCTSKLVPAESAKGTMFLARGTGGRLFAVPHDPKQSRLFEMPTSGKDLAAGEKKNLT